MKINLYDLFDLADMEHLNSLPYQSLIAEQDNDLNNRIIAKVLPQIKKPKRTGKIIALAVAAAIFISSVSVFGEVFFKPSISQLPIIETMDGVDLEVVGQELNLSSTQKNLTFVLNQVLSDNSRMLLYFTCPEYKGYETSPTGIDIFVNGEKAKRLSVGIISVRDNISCVSISGLEDIYDDMDILIEFSGFSYVNDKGWVKSKYSLDSWNFNFKSFGNTIRKELNIKPFKYKNKVITPTCFVISPLGYEFNFAVNSEEMNDIPIEIEMTDGSVFSTEKGILPSSFYFSDENNYEYKISGDFQTIIDTDKIKTIKIFDSIVYQ